LKVKDPRYNGGRHQGHHQVHRRCSKHSGQKYFIFLYFFEPRVVGKHGRKNIRGYFKNLNSFLRQQRAPKKDIIGFINVNVLVGEN
jgi:hypothetical protein